MAKKDHALAEPLMGDDGSVQNMDAEHPEHGKHTRGASLRSSALNLAATILGSGTLAMPGVCQKTGVLLFLVLLVVMALLADFAVYLLGEVTAKLSHVPRIKYPSMGKELFGKPGELSAQIAVILQQIGACTAYVVIIADVMTPIVGLALTKESFFCQRWPLQLAVVIVVVFPLCLLRRMDSLKYTSTASVCFILTFTVFLAVTGVRVLVDSSLRVTLTAPPDIADVSTCTAHFLKATDKNGGGGPPVAGDTIDLFKMGTGLLLSLPICAFSFLCHQNVFPIIEEMDTPSPRRVALVGHISMSFCLVVYFIAGSFGYMAFLDATRGDVLQNYQVSGNATYYTMDVIRMGIGCAVMLIYPLVVWEARSGVDTVIFGENKPYSFWRYFGLNVGLVGGTTLLGILIPKIETVLGFVGSTCSPFMVYVLPAAFFLKCNQRAVQAGEQSASQGKVWASYLLLAWGFVMIPLALTITILKQVGAIG